MIFAGAVKNPFVLDELAEPAAKEVANCRNAHSHDEHVEAGPKNSAAREHRSGAADDDGPDRTTLETICGVGDEPWYD